MTTMVPSGHPRLLCSTSDTRPDADADQEHVSTSSTSSSTANQQQAASNTSWLQLGLPYPDPPQQQDALMLDLNLGSSSNNNNNPRPHYYYVIRGTGGSPTSSYNPLPIIPPSFSNNPFISDQHPHMWSTGLGSSTHPPIPTNNPFISPPSPFFSDFKLIQPRPRPPPPPIWFMLQPSLHQCTQPFLPPLSKCFLRIKDGRMTVGLVMKYLATKLGLHTESQVEIRCREQVLEPFLTLQHVRDQIWSRSDAVILLPNSSTSPHLMLLHYATTSASSTSS
ncbi:hypothetical protein RND81_11G000900 [Saponaria officinalis]|uniref:Uncharacterized protein n=1 Tax=Saponaria officinalis TaxID=3572 RepID=A0AAW1HG72_SAPOF